MNRIEQPTSSASPKKKVLLVDESPVAVASFAKMLTSDKFQTIQATSGKTALEIAFQELPDLILLDVRVPDPDGFEVTRRLKNDPRTHNIPVILITALHDQNSRHTGLEAGAEDFLSRPVSRYELMTRVNSMITLKDCRNQLPVRDEPPQISVANPETPDSQTEPSQELPLVLLVEDNEGDARLIQHHLKDMPLHLEWVTYGKDALEFSRSGKVDLILLDIFLPDMDGFEVCRQIKQTDEGRDIPIVIVTCLDDIESKIKSIELNTDDFLVKPVVGRELRARTKILLERKRKQDKLRSHQEAVMNSELIDWLTGLHNHDHIGKLLDLEIKRSLRHRYPVGLIMIDIDDLKKYNDAYGRFAGDALLQKLAEVIKKTVREIDLLARYGEDTFAVVLPNSDGQGALQIATRIAQAIRAHDFSQDIAAGPKTITVSMGVAWYPRDAFQAKELVKSAQQRLLAAQQKGKNQIST